MDIKIVVLLQLQEVVREDIGQTVGLPKSTIRIILKDFRGDPNQPLKPLVGWFTYILIIGYKWEICNQRVNNLIGFSSICVIVIILLTIILSDVLTIHESSFS